MLASLKTSLLSAATAPYRDTGALNYHWARGKLGRDPIFTHLLDQNVFPNNARVLDLGCGRGLLAAWFLAAEMLSQRKQWPADQAAPPRSLSFRGVELIGREAECGNRALQPRYPQRVVLESGDMRKAHIESVDLVAMLDVLHYIPYADQDALLDRIRAALPPGGIFLTRVGDARSGLRFAITRLVDRGIMFVQGHRIERLWCRPIDEWVSALEERDFRVAAQPMSAGTPFANVMLTARLPSTEIQQGATSSD